MKIYTKKGDKGYTSLLGGTRVPKHHIRIATYGTVDELNANLGMLKSVMPSDLHKGKLEEIQNHLFTMCSQFATDPSKSILKNGRERLRIEKIGSSDISFLEAQIDAMDKVLPPLRNFIIPGGHPVVAQCHIARTVCRRAERCASLLNENEEVDQNLLKYLNRLSDYLFVLSRKLAVELEVSETKFRSRKSEDK